VVALVFIFSCRSERSTRSRFVRFFGDRSLYTASSVATAEASQKMGLSKEEPFSAKAAQRVHSSHAL
jgi:hypothetical protein